MCQHAVVGGAAHVARVRWYNATQTINNSIVYNSYKSDGSGGTTLGFDIYGYGGTTDINYTLLLLIFATH